MDAIDLWEIDFLVLWWEKDLYKLIEPNDDDIDN